MKLKLVLPVIAISLLLAGCNAERNPGVSPSGDVTQNVPSASPVTASPQPEDAFIVNGELDKEAVMAAYRENQLDTAKGLVRLYTNAIKSGQDLAKGEDGIAMFDLLFDRQTLTVKDVRPDDTMPDGYRCDLVGNGPNGERVVPLTVIFQDDDPRFFCPLSRYGKQSRESVENYINYLLVGDAAKLSQWLSIDGGSDEFLDEASSLIEYYSQYDLGKTEIVGFDYDNGLDQFVYSVLDGKNETFEILMSYGDGFSMPATSSVLEVINKDPDLQYSQEYIAGTGNIKGNVDTKYFSDRSADFEIGANRDGYAVFKNPDAAFATLKKDYKAGIELIQKEFNFVPLSQANYEGYKNLGWQVTTGTEEEKRQASFVTGFMDIYENSYGNL